MGFRLFLALFTLFPHSGWALDLGGLDPTAIVSGSNLTGTELQTLADALAADLRFRPVEGARAKRDAFTLSVGVLAGGMSSSKIQDAFPAVTNVPPVIPQTDVIVVVQVSHQIAFELGFIPSLNIQDNKISKFGGDIKWIASRSIFGDRSPFELALRASYSKPSLTLVSSTASIDYSASIMGVGASISRPFGGFEPYIGLAYLKHSGTMTGSGSGSLFGTSISLSQGIPIDVSSSSAWLYGGFQLGTGLFAAAFEVENSFGSLSGLLKLSFQFGLGGSQPTAEQRMAAQRRRQQAQRSIASDAPPPPPAESAPAPTGKQQPARGAPAQKRAPQKSSSQDAFY